jgi:LysR family nitrogen assimilation transcriptional regulator
MCWQKLVYLSLRSADVDLRQLRYLVTIIDCGSISKAAEQLHIAQPALSQQMAALESELQVPLLLRSSQGVKASAAGKALYRHARAVLRQLQHAREELTEGGVAESGRVAIGLPTSAARVLAMPLFKTIRAKYPGIFLQIFESLSGYLAELLANNRLDMAILFRDMATRGISIQPLVEEDLFLVGDIPGTDPTSLTHARCVCWMGLTSCSQVMSKGCACLSNEASHGLGWN